MLKSYKLSESNTSHTRNFIWVAGKKKNKMGSDNTNLEFLKEIGLGSSNIGSYINGQWKATGSSVTSVNPSNNQVHLLIFFFSNFYCLFCEALLVFVFMCM